MRTRFKGFLSLPSEVLPRYPRRGALLRWLCVGAAAGAASVLVVDLAVAALLYALELALRAPYSAQPSLRPAAAELWSLAAWGALWGAGLALAVGRLQKWRLLFGAALFAAVVPTLVAWLIAGALEQRAASSADASMAMAIGVLVNSVWGFGTGIGLALFGRRRGGDAENRGDHVPRVG